MATDVFSHWTHDSLRRALKCLTLSLSLWEEWDIGGTLVLLLICITKAPNRLCWVQSPIKSKDGWSWIKMCVCFSITYACLSFLAMWLFPTKFFLSLERVIKKEYGNADSLLNKALVIQLLQLLGTSIINCCAVNVQSVDFQGTFWSNSSIYHAIILGIIPSPMSLHGPLHRVPIPASTLSHTIWVVNFLHFFSTAHFVSLTFKHRDSKLSIPRGWDTRSPGLLGGASHKGTL